MKLTRIYSFSASHRLHAASLDAARNLEVYGRCNNPYGHGHNYRLEVSVSGDVDPRTGRVVDPVTLDQAVARLVLDAFDHRNMNEEIADLAGSVPTTEVVAAVIEQRLAAGWRKYFPENKPALARVRIHETRNNVFEVAAGQPHEV